MLASSNASKPTIPVSIAMFATSDDARSKFRLQTIVVFKSAGRMSPKASPVVPGPDPRIAVFGLVLIEFLTKLQVVELESWISTGKSTLTRLRGFKTEGKNWKATNNTATTRISIGFQTDVVCLSAEVSTKADSKLMLRAKTPPMPGPKISKAVNALTKNNTAKQTTLKTVMLILFNFVRFLSASCRHCRKIKLQAAKIASPTKLPIGLNPRP